MIKHKRNHNFNTNTGISKINLMHIRYRQSYKHRCKSICMCNTNMIKINCDFYNLDLQLKSEKLILYQRTIFNTENKS